MTKVVSIPTLWAKGIALALLLSGAADAQAPNSTVPLASPPATSPASTTAARPPIGQGENGDWAYVGRYRGANADLTARHPRPQVVFIGDSITEAWAHQPSFAADATRVGRGIGGQTAPQMLVRFRSDVINLKPAVVHIMAGTNDVAEITGVETDSEIEGYIASMVELARKHRIRVVLASIPPAMDFPWHSGLNPAPRIKTLNEWLKGYAAKRGVVYVDYWPVLATPLGAMKKEFSRDGVHPSAAGYAAMEPLATEAIKRATR
jgi:lysophospholipase L1-like esterase